MTVCLNVRYLRYQNKSNTDVEGEFGCTQGAPAGGLQPQTAAVRSAAGDTPAFPLMLASSCDVLGYLMTSAARPAFLTISRHRLYKVTDTNWSSQ